MGWVAIGAGEVHGHGEVELSTTRDKLQERGPPFHLINRAQYIPTVVKLIRIFATLPVPIL